MSYSFPDTAQFASKWGGPPGPQPTPSSACLVWIGLNSLATGGSRGTRADQGVCPTIPVQFPALENYMTLGALACGLPPWSGPLRLFRNPGRSRHGGVRRSPGKTLIHIKTAVKRGCAKHSDCAACAVRPLRPADEPWCVTNPTPAHSVSQNAGGSLSTELSQTIRGG
jgi:hypothetical protein